VVDLSAPEALDAAAWIQPATRIAVLEAAAMLRDHPAALALVVGGRISPGPGDRGRRRLERFVRRLADDVRRVAPGLLIAYRSSAGEAFIDTVGFDFDLYQVDAGRLSTTAALAALHVPGLDRPVVLALVGDSDKDLLDQWLAASLEGGFAGVCVEIDATNPPDDEVADVLRRGFAAEPLDLRDHWPRISVVVCAYQAEALLDRCLTGLGAVRYPDFEIIVVDDGSSDNTVAVARARGVSVIEAGRNGLSGARNIGLEAATGEIVAYLDADAWPDPDWLTYIALAFDGDQVVAAGGPNLCPPDDPPVAQCVSRSAGGPSPVLVASNRAEIVPGCNLSIRASSLRAIGGFDRVYRAAGDDVDVCWRLLETQGLIAYHHGAMVWHQRRASVRGALRQQRGYGTAEVMLARAHPSRFTSLGVPVLTGSVQGPKVPGWHPTDGPVTGARRLTRRVRRRHLAAGFVVLSAAGLWQRRLLAAPILLAAAVVSGHLADGVSTARRERVQPVMRRGLLIGLLNLLLPFPRTAGRLAILRTRLLQRE
jgi:O-antigen biosynthesis protein